MLEKKRFINLGYYDNKIIKTFLDNYPKGALSSFLQHYFKSL